MQRPEGKNHVIDLSVDGVVLKLILRKWDWGEVHDWIDLAQDSDKWRALVKAEMNFRVP